MIQFQANPVHDYHCRNAHSFDHEYKGGRTYGSTEMRHSNWPSNHVWHRRSNWLDLCGELIPLWQIPIRVGNIPNVDHHVNVFQVSDNLVSSVQWSWLVVVVLVGTICFCLKKFVRIRLVHLQRNTKLLFGQKCNRNRIKHLPFPCPQIWQLVAKNLVQGKAMLWSCMTCSRYGYRSLAYGQACRCTWIFCKSTCCLAAGSVTVPEQVKGNV